MNHNCETSQFRGYSQYTGTVNTSASLLCTATHFSTPRYFSQKKILDIICQNITSYACPRETPTTLKQSHSPSNTTSQRIHSFLFLGTVAIHPSSASATLSEQRAEARIALQQLPLHTSTILLRKVPVFQQTEPPLHHRNDVGLSPATRFGL